MYKFIIAFFSFAFLLSSCQNTSTEEDTEDTTESITATIRLEKVWETDTLLTTPESVFYDKDRSIYYVSCIGAVPPWTNDGDGFIAKIDEQGKIVEQKWVTGLNGPKGLGMFGDTLYVNDNDRLVAIDVTTGEIIKKMPIADAKNLNDITTDTAGNLYLSDSKTSTSYKVTGEEVTMIVHDTIIGGLNGIFSDQDRLIFAGFGSGDLFTFDKKTAKLTQVSDAMVGGDGVEKYGDGFFVSSWHGAIYHLDKDWNRTKILNTEVQGINAADIEVVADKELLLIPTFFDNRVMAYKVIEL